MRDGLLLVRVKTGLRISSVVIALAVTFGVARSSAGGGPEAVSLDGSIWVSAAPLALANSAGNVKAAVTIGQASPLGVLRGVESGNVLELGFWFAPEPGRSMLEIAAAAALASIARRRQR
jgi:hypothetical protein